MGKRLEFSDKTKSRRWEHAGGCCESCGKSMRTGDGPEYDHDKPAFYGGGNDFDNCRVLCVSCHSLKTVSYNSHAMPKSRRMIKKAAGLRGKKLKGRPMAGTKASGLRKRMNGEVERW